MTMRYSDVTRGPEGGEINQSHGFLHKINYSKMKYRLLATKD